jgi:hypothetical protein
VVTSASSVSACSCVTDCPTHAHAPSPRRPCSRRYTRRRQTSLQVGPLLGLPQRDRADRHCSRKFRVERRNSLRSEALSMLPRICALVGLRAIDIFQLSGLRLNQPRDCPASSSISPLAVRCPAFASLGIERYAGANHAPHGSGPGIRRLFRHGCLHPVAEVSNLLLSATVFRTHHVIGVF